MDRTKLRWNGWGWAARKDELAARDDVWAFLAQALEMPALLATPPRPLDELALPPARLSLEDRVELGGIVGTSQIRDSLEERAFHARGRSYRDLLLLRNGEISPLPDAVIYPRGSDEVLAILALAAERNIGVVPFGGGTCAPPALRGDCASVIALDLTEMDHIGSIDPVSLTAEVEAGIYGPALETALKAKGLTLNHCPAEFEFSTLGGFIAQGDADWLISAKLATPKGLIEASTPELLALVKGSRGHLGIVTEAVLRVQPVAARHEHRAYLFANIGTAMAALRAAAQEDIRAELQLFDAEHTSFQRRLEGLGKTQSPIAKLAARYAKWRGFTEAPCLMLASFDGDNAHVAFAQNRFRHLASRFGVLALGQAAGESFRQQRFQSYYLRDSLLDRGAGLLRFELRTSWAKLASVYETCRMALEQVLSATSPREGAKGLVLGQLVQARSDSVGIVFTAIFPRAIGADLEQEEKITAVARQAITMAGGALQGADQAPQSETGLGGTLRRALKQSLDPMGVMRPKT
nr:FAD-binding oxidoreductase [Rhizomicrobium palustre]